MSDEQQGREIDIAGDVKLTCVTYIHVDASNLEDPAIVTVDYPCSGDVRALRQGRYVTIPREAFYTWLYGLIGVTAIVVPTTGWTQPMYIDFDQYDASHGLKGVAEWRDGRRRTVTLTPDQLWDDLCRLAGREG